MWERDISRSIVEDEECVNDHSSSVDGLEFLSFVDR